MLKTTNHKGFTIIEVVITIAIGAAVMALVLNAVQGARRSQRNNARVADVGAIAAAVNNYYGSRNVLPSTSTDIEDPLIDQLAYYPDGAGDIDDIFRAEAWRAARPATAGTFLTWDGTGTTANTLGNATDGTPTAGAGTQLTEDGGEDLMVLVRQAACSADFSEIEAGGIREMALVYRLEGDSKVICREI